MKLKIIITAFAASCLIFSSTQAFALFSISVGVPISQSFTAKNADGSKVAESDGVSGVFLHASLPIFDKDFNFFSELTFDLA